MVYEDPTFFVKGGDVGFADRQKNIFGKLTVAEKERNERQQEAYQSPSNDILSTGNCVTSLKRGRSEMKQFRGKESIFKRPDAPPPRLKTRDVPDHHRNPHKWIKYSLGDVSQEDMSDRSNTAAALAFLKEMQERKRLQVMEADDSAPVQITFKQPKNKPKPISKLGAPVCLVSGMTSGESTTGEDIITRPSFRSSKLIMPEYVVGMTKKKDKKKHDKHVHLPQNENITSVIKLQHLMADDGGE